MNASYPYTLKLVNANSSVARDNGIVNVDATSGNIVISLLDVTTCKGQDFFIKKVDTSSNTVTVTPSSGQTIEGASTIVLSTSNEWLGIYSDGVKWYIDRRTSSGSSGADSTKLFNIAPTVSKSVSFTASANIRYSVDATSGNITATLPGTGTLGNIIFVQKSDATANIVYLSGTINGTSTSTFPLRTQLQGKLLEWDGVSSWNVIAGDLSLPALDARYAAAGSGGGITTLTGDVSASGTGSVAATVAFANDTLHVLKSGDTMTGNLSTTGAIMSSGVFTETTTTPGVYSGIVSGTPRILFAQGVAASNWEIDNNGSSFRFFLPSNTRLTIDGTSMTTYGNVIPNAGGTLRVGGNGAGAGNFFSTSSITKQYFNATAYLDGATAGQVTMAGSLARPYIAKSAAYTLLVTDWLVECTSGTFTITLPTAVGASGREYKIKNSGAGVITIATTSSQTIDGVTTYSLTAQYKYVTVVSNGAAWIIIGNN